MTTITRCDFRWAAAALAAALACAAPAHAGCAYTGVCGTFVYLGKTADLRKAVFMSQTTTAGGYLVYATEGGGGPIDTWTTLGSDTHITVSNFPQTWGGTHILRTSIGTINPADIASATQSPGGQVFPVGYLSPNSKPPASVIQALTPLGDTSFNTARPPQVADNPAVVMDTQSVPPPLKPPPQPQPIVEPPPQPQQFSNPLVPPPLPQTVVAGTPTPGVSTPGGAVQPQVAPSIATQQLQARPPAVQTPPVRPPVVTALAQPTIVTPGGATLPQRAPQAVTQTLQPTGTGTTTLQPPPLQPVTIAAQTPAVVASPGGAVLPQVAPVASTQQLQAITPAVQTPPVRPPVVSALAQPAVVTPGGATLPQQAPRAVTQTLQPAGQGTPSLQPPPLQPVVVAAQTPPTVVTPGGAVQPQTVPQIPLQQVQTTPSAVQSQTGLPQLPTVPQTPSTAGRPSTSERPAVLREACVAPPRTDGLPTPPLPAACRADEAGWRVWTDRRYQRSRDNRGGLQLDSRHHITTIGAEQKGRPGPVFGLSLSEERERGTVLSPDVHVSSRQTTLAGHVNLDLDDRRQVSAGLGYTQEVADIEVLGLSGRTRADHLALHVAASTYLPMGAVWLLPSVQLQHTFSRGRGGRFTGTVGATALDVVTDGSRDDGGVATAGVELGSTFAVTPQIVLAPHVQMAAHYRYSGPSDGRWRSDLRLGLRAQVDRAGVFDVSVGRLGMGEGGADANEVRLLWLLPF